jgi:hypothetical protein
MQQRRAGIVEREQPRISASPKIATVNAPKANSASVTRPVSKRRTCHHASALKESNNSFRNFGISGMAERQKNQP